MKFIPPTETRLQCPECGVPVESLETHGIVDLLLDPCGHIVRATTLIPPPLFS